MSPDRSHIAWCTSHSDLSRRRRLALGVSVAVAVTIVLPASSATAQTIPAGWTATDVGTPAIAGSASYSAGVFTVEGAGADIWNAADQFMFVHRAASGDGDMIARIDSLLGADNWSKAGVMVRESVAPGARHAMVAASEANGIAFQRRSSTNGSSAHTGVSGTEPVWVRLSRRGSTFTAYRSADGAAWVRIASASIAMPADARVGLAVTSHNTSALATARFSSVEWIPVAAAAGTLPQGWTSSDVGAPSIAGSATASGASSFALTGAGADVWGSSDQFRFAYRFVTGDVTVIARVAQVQRANDWSKAGVMVRGSLAANSPHGFMLVSAGNGLAFQRRQTAGASSLHTSGGSGQAPAWVKLERRGTTLLAYRSSDGTAWTLVDTDTVTLGESVYVGLAVTSHDISAATTAAFDNVTVTAAGASPPNQPPTASLTGPANGATYAAPASIAITATATDTDGSVARVDFYANGTSIGSDAAAPFAFTWTGVPAGAYSLTAVARDDDGAATTSGARSVTVSANQAPAVSLTAPVNGATYTAPATVALAATASDADGSVARVDFYAGSTLLGSDTTAPYGTAWSNVGAGSYALTAVARDNTGNTTVSSTRTVTVTQTAVPTQAIFVPSTDHATAVDRYLLEIFASGATPGTDAPIATQELGKPAVVNGECVSDVAQTITALTPGSYFGTVTAIGPGGTARSAPSPNFTR